MNAGRLLKTFRRDVADAKRNGADLIEWHTHTQSPAVNPATVTLAELRTIAARLAETPQPGLMTDAEFAAARDALNADWHR